jgi:hypothetical protein
MLKIGLVVPKSFYTGQCAKSEALIHRRQYPFLFDIERNRRVKAGRRSNPGRVNQRQAFTPAVI